MFFFTVLAPGLMSDLRWYGLSTIDPNDCSISMWGTHGCVNIYVYTTCLYIYIYTYCLLDDCLPYGDTVVCLVYYR